MSAVTRRQEHGIKAEPITLTVAGEMKARLIREARRQDISVSRHVVNLVRLAWSVQGALAATPTREVEEEQVPA